MIPTFVITLREGVEASLIIGIIQSLNEGGAYGLGKLELDVGHPRRVEARSGVPAGHGEA